MDNLIGFIAMLALVGSCSNLSDIHTKLNDIDRTLSSMVIIIKNK